MEPTASRRTVQLYISSIRQSAVTRALARGISSGLVRSTRVKLLRVLLIVIITALGGCQTAEHIQFTVPQQRITQLIAALRSIGLRRNMADKTRESEVADTFAVVSEGDLSFTQLGARRHKGEVLVDLFFRSAGIGGQLYKQLEPEVTQALQQLYPGRVTIERDYRKIVPIHPKPNQTMQPTSGRRTASSSHD